MAKRHRSSGSKRNNKDQGPREPAPPLEMEKVEEIKAYIAAHDSVVQLGRLARDFVGIRKEQLEPYFHIDQGPHTQNHVMISLILDDGTPAIKKQKTVDPAAALVDVVPLEDATREAVEAFLVDAGGATTLGKLSRKFAGTKKVQLELAGFHFLKVDSIRDDIVCLTEMSAEEATAIVEAAVAANPPPADRTRTTGDARKGASKGGRDGKGGGKQGGKGDGLPPMMLPMVMQQIMQAGGWVQLSHLTRMFPGVKKSQYEKHFMVTSSPDGNATVCMPQGGLTKRPQQNNSWEAPMAFGGGAFGGGYGAFGGAYAAAQAQSFGGKGGKGGKSFGKSAEGDGSKCRPNARLRKLQGEGGEGGGQRTRLQGEPPVMDEAKVSEIGNFLLERGGSSDIGPVARAFPGVKKGQLSLHFSVDEGVGGNCVISVAA